MKKATIFYFFVNAFAIFYSISFSSINSPQWQVQWLYQYAGCALGIIISIILYYFAPSQIVPKEISVIGILVSSSRLLLYYITLLYSLSLVTSNLSQLYLILSGLLLASFQYFVISNYLLIRKIKLPTAD